MDLEKLVADVASEVAQPEQADELEREVKRLASGKGGTSDLSAELLITAGLIVQVCTIVVDCVKLSSEFRSKNRNDQLVEVLAKLAERSGESTDGDETLTRVAGAALEVLDKPKKRGWFGKR